MNDALRELNHDLEVQVAARTAELAQSHDELLAANAKLKASFITTIKVFSSMIEMRGGALAGHARRVADLARRIAVHMDLSAHDTQEVFFAALLKDIGKIGFSDDLLGLPVSAMSGEQLGMFRTHPERAGHLLMALEDLRGAAALLRAQLERHDGAGFPHGLHGIAIPVGARILALAADYDGWQSGAMAQRRLHPDDAAQLVYDSSGKRYDPDVVAAFRHVIGGGEELDDLIVLAGELVPGMVLSRDLFSREGLMLLSAEHVIDARLIQQVLDFENKSAGRLTIRVHQPNHSVKE
jgi:response regulator RpfG family c-di-GMP phosphodiesterase